MKHTMNVAVKVCSTKYNIYSLQFHDDDVEFLLLLPNCSPLNKIKGLTSLFLWDFPI